ncbi:MAG: GMC family oxidoreductase [Arcicella sp.]|jgi:choline dehydrogenase-like flavoprotein|nr:GMC family oxidoreductase [Arcicella sp.]
MANFNIDATKIQTYDAIVIGSGISGGWAAKELTQKGLRTLVLERGRDVKHVVDYKTAMDNPWDAEHHGRLPLTITEPNPIVSKCYAFDEHTQDFFVKDQEHPYQQEKPFDWIRGYQVGGKSLLWARQTQRWSDFDFEGPARDGFAVDWPIRYKDLAPWYSYVEKFAGISGNRDGIPNLPDGEFLPAMELNCVEKHLQSSVAKFYKDRQIITGRCAHLTEPKKIHLDQGRGQCQYRHLCYRGCPFGGYFSSNSSTLPAAAKTGKLTLRPHSVVHSILYDETKKKAKGVRIVDTITKKTYDYFARIIFVNAAAMNTNLLLLNSTSNRFPNGLGNDSGLLGKYVAFHNYRARVTAQIDGFDDQYYIGRRPNAAYMPRFRNLYQQDKDADFLRGWATYIDASRQRGTGLGGDFGAEMKTEMTKPGPWNIFVMAMGETIPKESNRVSLSKTNVDAWGIPQLVTNIDYDANDEKMIKDFHQQGTSMLEKAGFKHIHQVDTHQAPGLDIHEMGGVRMGKDAKTSLLNGFNQLHHCKNVFVTDGACMTSVSTQNPSLTFMAMTARAADYAVKEMKATRL